jgi:hypothetical protein
LIELDGGVPSGDPGRGAEREAHAAADEDGVDSVEEAGDQAEFVGYFGASEHGHERSAGCVEED